MVAIFPLIAEKRSSGQSCSPPVLVPELLVFHARIVTGAGNASMPSVPTGTPPTGSRNPVTALNGDRQADCADPGSIAG
jgi:hypothetical protein